MIGLPRRRSRDLSDLLRQRIDSTNARTTDTGNWLIGLTVACEVQDMESALERAGLADGVEPNRSAYADHVQGSASWPA